MTFLVVTACWSNGHGVPHGITSILERAEAGKLSHPTPMMTWKRMRLLSTSMWSLSLFLSFITVVIKPSRCLITPMVNKRRVEGEEMKNRSWTVSCYYNSLSNTVNVVRHFSPAPNNSSEVIIGLALGRHKLSWARRLLTSLRPKAGEFPRTSSWNLVDVLFCFNRSPKLKKQCQTSNHT